MEVEAWHDDNDASGIIFGIDPAATDLNVGTTFYQTWMMNDAWPDNATDFVPGPHLKFARKNALPCKAYMTVDDDCYDLIKYSALDTAQAIEDFPNARLTDVDWFPKPYSEIYDPFKLENEDKNPVKFTLIVYKGEARVYFMSRMNLIVSIWTDLGADYG